MIVKVWVVVFLFLFLMLKFKSSRLTFCQNSLMKTTVSIHLVMKEDFSTRWFYQIGSMTMMMANFKTTYDNLYDSQSAFKLLWRLHYHTSCSYQLIKVVLKSFCLQEFKQKEKKRRVYVKPWLKRKKT